MGIRGEFLCFGAVPLNRCQSPIKPCWRTVAVVVRTRSGHGKFTSPHLVILRPTGPKNLSPQAIYGPKRFQILSAIVRSTVCWAEGSSLELQHPQKYKYRARIPRNPGPIKVLLDFFQKIAGCWAEPHKISPPNQHSFAPAGMESSTMRRLSFSSPFSVWTAEISIPQLSWPIIFLGGRLTMATRVLPMSSSGL